MLELIREKAQSFGVKLAFGVIILVFVFWGVGNFNDRDYSNVVAVVNGEPILARQFELAYRDAEQSLLSQNPGLTRKDLEQQHLGRQVLRDLITQTLLQQEAARAGIAASPQELREAAGKIRAFQDDQGNFDPAAYKRVLEAQRISPAQFERDMARDILRDKLFGLLTAGSWVDEGEARRRYDFLRQKRDVSLVFLPASGFAPKDAPDAAEEAQWYEQHKEQFRVPPRASVEYVLISPAALAKPEELTDSAIRAWYEANPGRFTDAGGQIAPFEKARAQAREGLAADLGAERLSETLDALIEDNILSRPLEQSAGRHGLAAARTALLDEAGLMRELGISAENARLILDLEAGSPLDTALEAGDRYLVVRQIESAPASVLPLDEVRGQVAQEIARQKAQEAAMQAAGAELEALKANKGAPVQKASGIERGGALPGYASNSALGEAIFNADKGVWLPAAYDVVSEKAGPGALLVRVDAIAGPDPAEWENIGSLMEEAVRRERGAELFGIFMQTLAGKAKVEITNPALVERLDGAGE